MKGTYTRSDPVMLRQNQSPGFPREGCSTCRFILGNSKIKLCFNKGFQGFFNTSHNNRMLPLPQALLKHDTQKPPPILQGFNYFPKANSFPSLLLVERCKVFRFLPLFFSSARNRLNWHFRMLSCSFSWALWFTEIYQKWQDWTSRRCLVVPRSSEKMQRFQQ